MATRCALCRPCGRQARRSPRSTSCPIRASGQELTALSDWPTIPQVFVKGELIGGADITEELFASGELKSKIDEALGAEHGQSVRTVPLELPATAA